eukprot:1159561-Pelagomonas_calceolata.AAC.6
MQSKKRTENEGNADQDWPHAFEKGHLASKRVRFSLQESEGALNRFSKIVQPRSHGRDGGKSTSQSHRRTVLGHSLLGKTGPGWLQPPSLMAPPTTGLSVGNPWASVGKTQARDKKNAWVWDQNARQDAHEPGISTCQEGEHGWRAAVHLPGGRHGRSSSRSSREGAPGLENER